MVNARAPHGLRTDAAKASEQGENTHFQAGIWSAR